MDGHVLLAKAPMPVNGTTGLPCPPADESTAMGGKVLLFLAVMALAVLALGAYCVRAARKMEALNKVAIEDMQNAAMTDDEKEEFEGLEDIGVVKTMEEMIAEQQAAEQEAAAGAITVIVGGVLVAIFAGDQIKEGILAAMEKAPEVDFTDALAAAEDLATKGAAAAAELAEQGMDLAAEGAEAGAEQAAALAELGAEKAMVLGPQACDAVAAAMKEMAKHVPPIQLAELQATCKEAGRQAFEKGGPVLVAASNAALAALVHGGKLSAAAAKEGIEEGTPLALKALAIAAAKAKEAGAKIEAALLLAAEKGAEVAPEALAAAKKLAIAAVPLAEEAAAQVTAGLTAAADVLSKVDLEKVNEAIAQAAELLEKVDQDMIAAIAQAGLESGAQHAVTAGAKGQAMFGDVVEAMGPICEAGQEGAGELLEKFIELDLAAKAKAGARIAAEAFMDAAPGAAAAAGSAAEAVYKSAVNFTIPAAGKKWVKDAAYAAGIFGGAAGEAALVAGAAAGDAAGEAAVAGKGFVEDCIENYGVDVKIFEIVRDWAQVMALIFSQILPSSPSFTLVFGYLFQVVALDIPALFAYASPAVLENIKFLWGMAIYIAGVVCLVAFCYIECTVGNNPNALEDGHEMVSYADKGSSDFKIRIVQMCHFLYLPITRTVFESWYLNFYNGGDRGLFFSFSFILFFGFTLLVPYRTFTLINENKPRGSTEEPDYTFDNEGNRVKLTDAVFLAMTKDMMDKKSMKYNPWATLWNGYERAWATFPVFVMGLKLIITLSVVFMAKAKVLQTILAMIITLVWTAVVKNAKPYLDNKADSTDFVSKLSKLITLVLSLVSVMVCKTPMPGCGISDCYTSGPGFIVGIIVNAFAGICIAFQGMMTVQAMPCYVLRLKNGKGMFEFTEHNPATHVDERAPSIYASLIYDLDREKKYRVWFPFWDGLFETWQESEDESNIELANRWMEIKSQAMDSGIKKITAWVENCDNEEVVEARSYLINTMEGIDVYCNADIADSGSGTLIKTAQGGDDELDSRTNFAKMYVTPFPTRAIIIWDDSEDRAALYDDKILQIVELNKSDGIQAKILLRRQLRCMMGQTVQYPFWRMESREVKDGQTEPDEEGNTKQKYKSVQVRFDYTQGQLAVSQNGKNTMDSEYNKTEFDVSQGFSVAVSFADGHGSTSECEGGEWVSQTASLGHGPLGISDAFEMGTMQSGVHRDSGDEFGIDDLINDNADLHGDTPMGELMDMHQRYRDDLQVKQAAREEILSCKFWPIVYNNPNHTRDSMCEWTSANCSESFNAKLANEEDAQNYLWERQDFVSKSATNLYWFTFFDDLWTENCKMKAIKDLGDVFGSADSNCLCYTPMGKYDFKMLLKKHELVGTLDKPPHLFFPELVDKLYLEMSRADQAINLSFAQKVRFLQAPWQSDPWNVGKDKEEEAVQE